MMSVLRISAEQVSKPKKCTHVVLYGVLTMPKEKIGTLEGRSFGAQSRGLTADNAPEDLLTPALL